MSDNESSSYRGGFPAYIPASKRRVIMAKMAEKLKARDPSVQPIEANTKRNFVSSFWGMAWCRHLESFADYESRLPKGRSYLRSGAILDLRVRPGQISAKVMGSELYSPKITIAPLPDHKWNVIKAAAAGQIDTIIDLINGQLSKGVLAAIVDKYDGLFPAPRDISMVCNCLDDAHLCKHIAAVLYGVGVRMDTDPSVLFDLRGVNQSDLITDIPGESDLDSSSLSDIFGVHIESNDS